MDENIQWAQLGVAGEGGPYCAAAAGCCRPGEEWPPDPVWGGGEARGAGGDEPLAAECVARIRAQDLPSDVSAIFVLYNTYFGRAWHKARH